MNAQDADGDQLMDPRLFKYVICSPNLLTRCLRGKSGRAAAVQMLMLEQQKQLHEADLDLQHERHQRELERERSKVQQAKSRSISLLQGIALGRLI